MLLPRLSTPHARPTPASLTRTLAPRPQPAGQVTSITTALTNLGNVSPQLYSLIQQILTALIKISTAQAAIQQLVSSGGTTGLLASLTNTGTIVTKLTSLLSTLFLTINSACPCPSRLPLLARRY